jgi:hypothetical protein
MSKTEGLNLLDAAILEAIANGDDTFSKLEGRFFETARKLTDGIAWRLIDRRIQTLRRAGKITYQGGKWHVARGAGSSF